ncbi:AI-2E family transporter [Streptococcus oricebi]|uniref:AI-2E family transporter n=1 Tax=Streptococcus oricebi TaxID=1547447 RepID=A0ABS5B5B2_9STRE|nr:AI-2E family transporter [Streptococcus oricebi]MBP2623886.1 AI-2E family transporter [Streptococcus oricebi]
MRNLFKSQYGLVFFAALCLAGVLYLGQIWAGINHLMTVFSPILLGGAMAFVFNVPMRNIENFLQKRKLFKGLERTLAILLVLICFSLIVAGTLAIVIPTLSTAVASLSKTINQFLPQFNQWLAKMGIFKAAQLNKLTTQLNQSGMVNKGVQLLASLTGNIGSVFGNFFTVIMAVFIMFSMLGSKEFLMETTTRIMRICLPDKLTDYLRYAGSVAVDTYNNFLMGQIMEAFIVGLLVFLSYSLTGLPYAAMIGVLAGILSFIPYIGPFTACGLGAIFIFTQSPVKALISILVFQLIQLVEGNLIYPRVVGSSVGLPVLFTLSAALIGGNLFGLVGMIFFTPLFAVIYRLTKEFVKSREAKEGTGAEVISKKE